MGTPRIEVGKIRREQIVEAAVAIIAEHGLQNLSLSAIEKRTAMSRGQLTYYFAAKEDILLAVFDRLLTLMQQRAPAADGAGTPCGLAGTGWERLRGFLNVFLLNPPPMREFHSLQYTFLSQIGHREDYRRRLASLYADWRQQMGAEVGPELARHGRRVAPKSFAALVQAILHGLAMQRAADPDAYDREEMLELVLDLLEGYLRGPAGNEASAGAPDNGRPPAPNGLSPRGRKARPSKRER